MYYITTSNIHTFSTDFSFDSFVVFSISHTYGYNILNTNKILNRILINYMIRLIYTYIITLIFDINSFTHNVTVFCVINQTR